MNKKLIRLTEGDLHKIVKESVNRILNEFKNLDTKLYNDRLDYYLKNGYDLNDAKSRAVNDCRERWATEHPYKQSASSNYSKEDLELDTAINNFMVDKQNKMWDSLPNHGIETIHRKDEMGNEWDEDFVHELGFRPSRDLFKKYLEKHNKTIDTRTPYEKEMEKKVQDMATQKGWTLKRH